MTTFEDFLKTVEEEIVAAEHQREIGTQLSDDYMRGGIAAMNSVANTVREIIRRNGE